MSRLPENIFKLSRFGKVNVLKKIDMNSIKDNKNRNYWIWKTKPYTKTLIKIKYRCRATWYYKVKTTISPENNVSIWFPIIKEQSIIVEPSYKSILVNNNKLKVS